MPLPPQHAAFIDFRHNVAAIAVVAADGFRH